MPKLSVLGLGYVGLPTAAMFATNGFEVIGVDPNPALRRSLETGASEVSEPGLNALVQAAFKSGNLTFREAPVPAEAYIIAVPTPLTDDKSPDLSYVEAASRSIVPCLAKGNLVILESTVPPGTTQNVVAPILEESGLRVGEDLYLAHCPERVLPGALLKELTENDRVIGGVTRESSERARDLYAAFVTGETHLTDAATAETAKVVENTYRDVNIALANELARVCTAAGLDVWEVIRLANLHPRVNVLNPGPGVGGHCIPVDPWFLVDAAPDEARLIPLSRLINDAQPELVASMVQEAVAGVDKPHITLIGLAYKGDIGDTRASPSLAVMERLISLGYDVRAFDPHVMDEVRTFGADEAFQGSDCAVLLVEHREALELDPATIQPLMRSPRLIDTRNFLDHPRWQAAGFDVRVLGR